MIGKEGGERLYRKWIDTALDKSFSDGILVERVGGRIVGIFVVKTQDNIGICPLIGVREDLRNKHLGKKLWNQAFGYWAHFSPPVDLIKVSFSLFNIPAIYFYKSVGFQRIHSIQYIYHYSKKGRNGIQDSF
jgi:GNAT superfamily N-acetyltransferase